MSLAIKYESSEDAKLRLRHTVVLYNGEPVYIQDVKAGNGKPDDILRVLFQPLPTTPPGGLARGDVFGRRRLVMPPEPAPAPAEDIQRKYISSKHFDIAPFRLGYVNAKTGAFYCQRLPNRVQKQGLCSENFRGFDNHKDAVSFQAFLSCPETPEMVAGKYPTLDQALACLKKVASIAFDRDFCLVRDEVIPDLIYLYYKGDKVGMYSRDEIKLGDKFKCLKEKMNELQLKVGGF